jgi:hypothetical protein
MGGGDEDEDEEKEDGSLSTLSVNQSCAREANGPFILVACVLLFPA